MPLLKKLRTFPWIRWLVWMTVILISVLYCWPGHPSVKSAGGDGAAHVVLFVGMLGVCWLGLGHAGMALMLVALLGIGLEVVQWVLYGYAQIEWADVAANELGAGMGFALVWLWRRRQDEFG